MVSAHKSPGTPSALVNEARVLSIAYLQAFFVDDILYNGVLAHKAHIELHNRPKDFHSGDDNEDERLCSTCMCAYLRVLVA